MNTWLHKARQAGASLSVQATVTKEQAVGTRVLDLTKLRGPAAKAAKAVAK